MLVIMLDEILPPQVQVVEAHGDIEAPLLAGEAAAVARAVDKRRREFATVRHCARTALSRLGLPPAPIVPGERGAPRWPAGVVGSMTHCDGYRAAAVAHASDLATLGVDAEPHQRLPPDVLSLVASPAEQEHLAALGATHPDLAWSRLMFAAKESVYKAWFPLTRRWLGFEDARVTFDLPNAQGGTRATGTFRADLLVPGLSIAGAQCSSMTGRFLVHDRLVVVAVAIAAGGAIGGGSG